MITQFSSRHAKSKHLAALDGVRLLAIGLVILHHTTGKSNSSVWLHLIEIQNANGFGHLLFFILSGTLISTVIIESRNSQKRYRTFLLRRFLRIFPLYFGYLICAYLLTRLITGTAPSHMWIYALFLQNVLFHLAEKTNSLLTTYHLWTIAVQDQFYLVWPLLLWRCRTFRQMRLLCCAGIALSLLTRIIAISAGIEPDVILHSLPAVASCMCLGGLLAVERLDPTWFTLFLKRAFLPLLAVCLMWMWKGLDFGTFSGSIFGYHLGALVCAGLIMIASTPETFVARIFGAHLFAQAGRNLAYGLYIFHPALLDFSTKYLGTGSKAVRLSIFLCSTILLSWLSYRFFETPFLRLKPRKIRAAPETHETSAIAAQSSLSA